MANYSRLATLKRYAIPHLNVIIFGVVSLLIVNALGVYIPLLIRDGIDDLRVAFNFTKVSNLAILIIVLTSIMWVIRMISRILIFGIGRKVEADLKEKLFAHILNLDLAYFATTTIGELITRSTSDVENIRRLFGFSVLSLANTIFAYALTLPVMLAINIKLSLMALGVYPAMFFIVQLFSDRLRNEQLAVQEKLGDLSDLIQEDMSGIALIKIYAQEDNERQAFAQKNHKLFKANLKLAQSRNTLFPIIQGLAYISLLILLWQGIDVIRSGEISVGNFLALILYAERLVFPTALLGFTITAYQRGEVSIDRVESILTVQPQIKDNSNVIQTGKKVQGQLIAKNLTFTYPGANKPALENINFTINSGETIAIVGPIGSGKSTLANAIPRLLNIPNNSLFLDGIDITQLSLDDLRKAISYVPQESFLFSTTIKNNISYGNPLANRTQIEEVAKEGQIHYEILNFPQQYDTIVGERGITLSGGQRQRTALARALLIDAPILILDDALASVDNQTATAILQNLDHGTDKKTVIFISHQLSAAAIADRIFVMDHGQIIQSGTHQELLNQSGLYQWLWSQNQLAELLK